MAQRLLMLRHIPL